MPELAIPSHWRTFTVGPFKLMGPADLRKKDVKGIDSEIYEYENEDFSIGIEIGMYSDESEIHSFEYETGSIMIDGSPVKYTKSDLNKPAANAATNADGSRPKPVEKHLLLEVRFPKENAVVSVNYATESSTALAMAILQTVRSESNN